MVLGAVAILAWACRLTALAAESLAAPATPPFVDYRGEQPGRTVKITAADLPKPRASKSADNPPRIVPRPPDAWPRVPPGFKVDEFASGLDNPRLARTAPNGDVFVVESDAGTIRVFRGTRPDGKAETAGLYAKGFEMPFGIAFYPPGPNPRWLYVANTDSVVRVPYQNGDLQARGPARTVVAELPGFGRLRGGGHWTRDIAFSLDGKRLFVSVGSMSNVDDPDQNPAEHHRADILEFSPESGGPARVYAAGIRNAVGIAVHPRSGELWASVNERDELGDDLVPDYITHVQEGGFYGWPWTYIGANPDPRHRGKHPELREKTIVPDVLLQPHSASMQMTFYDGAQFPAAYRGDIFAASHGSWNRRVRTGYAVLRLPMQQSHHATGAYEYFMTGFVLPDGRVWGRPVGVTVAKDGALLVTDDGADVIWRVSAR
jgi:glucose/arabinose dehydrogenase